MRQTVVRCLRDDYKEPDIAWVHEAAIHERCRGARCQTRHVFVRGGDVARADTQLLGKEGLVEAMTLAQLRIGDPTLRDDMADRGDANLHSEPSRPFRCGADNIAFRR